MSERTRTDTGQYVETVTLERVLDVFEQIDAPAITSSDVSDTLDCSTEAARQKLKRLHDQGHIRRRKTGRTVLWWLAEPVARDDRSAIEERAPGEILNALDTFHDERDTPTEPLPSAEAVRDDYHAHRHRENLERLAVNHEDE